MKHPQWSNLTGCTTSKTAQCLSCLVGLPPWSNRYDNEHKFWVARNSFSAEFADNGNFKVRVCGCFFGTQGALTPSGGKLLRSVRFVCVDGSLVSPNLSTSTYLSAWHGRQVAYGAAGVLNPGDTFGVVFKPAGGSVPGLALLPSKQPGCGEYKVRSQEQSAGCVHAVTFVRMLARTSAADSVYRTYYTHQCMCFGIS